MADSMYDRSVIIAGEGSPRIDAGLALPGQKTVRFFADSPRERLA